MKKVLFSVLMISAMFVLASCGSKSNSNEATAEETTSEEAATPKCEPADPPFTYSKLTERFGDKYENVPLEGVFEMQKVALAKVKGKIRYSSQLSGEGDCLSITINLKMINDFSQEPNFIYGSVQILNKDEAVLWECDVDFFRGRGDLPSLEKGETGILSYQTNNELDVDGILANARYVRITGFKAGKEISE